jgi:required for meiotic nuclear division protein 1
MRFLVTAPAAILPRKLMAGPIHSFHAVAFVENFSLKELAPAYPEAKRTPHELWFASPTGGMVFIYPFGAVVFHNVNPETRGAEITRLHRARPGLTPAQVVEEFTVREDPGASPDMVSGLLVLDRMTFERASVVALTVAQSVAMEYYDRIVDQMFVQTEKLADRLEKKGNMPLATRSLHRFIGAAISTRSEVLSILHLLDKPDALWEDPGADAIYGQLRAEFDLVDRYQALELKLRSVQEALELVLDMARDRRLFLLEASIVLLIVLEIVLNLWRH